MRMHPVPLGESGEARRKGARRGGGSPGLHAAKPLGVAEEGWGYPTWRAKPSLAPRQGRRPLGLFRLFARVDGAAMGPRARQGPQDGECRGGEGDLAWAARRCRWLALAVRIRGRYRLAETPDAQRRCLQGMKGGSGRSAPSTRPLAKSAGMPKDWT